MTRISLLTVLSVLTVAGGLCASSFGAGAELFISPSGDDANPGTKEKPFATLEAARDAARSRRKSGPVTVRLGGGDYFRTKTFSLAQEDSGRVSFVASPGAKVRLIGARIVKSVRRIVLHLATGYPYQQILAIALRRLVPT